MSKRVRLKLTVLRIARRRQTESKSKKTSFRRRILKHSYQ